MRILVTGAGGFIGRCVVGILLAEGHNVVALVRYSSTGGWGGLELYRSEPHARLSVHLGDISDSNLVRSLVRECEVVIHMAALIGVPYGFRAPESYVRVNVLGTLNVLEAIREAPSTRLVITSTSEVYGSARTLPMDESHPLQAQSVYSASKIAADALAESFARGYELPIVILRPFNTYGPGQSRRAIIPTILCQLISGAPELRIGSLEPQRDFTFVDDTARAFAAAATTSGIEGRTIHLGTGESVSIRDLADLCQKIVGTQVPIVPEQKRVRAARSEVAALRSDPSLAKRLLAWQPRVSLETGLSATAESLRAIRSSAPWDYVL